MNWPVVLDEDETLDRVIAGESLARFGDGEFNLIFGSPCKTQPYIAPIGATLKVILESGNCLVGIPRQGIGPKSSFWREYFRSDIITLLKKPSYASAFITRPDSAPWIDRPSYWRKIKSLWDGKKVTLVRGSHKSLTSEMLKGARAVKEITCPPYNAYARYGDILQMIGDDNLVLLCLGPTATILAADLAQRGQHAIDLGHVGMFLGKHERGEPMMITDADKEVDKKVRLGYERQKHTPSEVGYELIGRDGSNG